MNQALVTRQAPRSAALAEPLRAAVTATGAAEREARLCDAYEEPTRRHHSLGLTEPIDTTRLRFFDCLLDVIGADRFALALFESITDERLRSLPPSGAVDRCSDNTDLLDQPHAIRAAGTAPRMRLDAQAPAARGLRQALSPRTQPVQQDSSTARTRIGPLCWR
ncbi:hypothetical protein [Glycomyces sp. NPDC021274]|uniref:hypothetical protein n=1 Tax=Glycomyces sp. NPDC021274 TaxID=3155120 RepID=UPI0033C6B374